MENNNVKVLMFGWELPPNNTGGLGVACYGLTKGMASQGAKIFFALPRSLPQGVPFMEVLPQTIEGVEVTAINSVIKPYMNNQEYCDIWDNQFYDASIPHGYSLYDEALRFGQLGSLWSRTKPHDIIHAHDWMTYPAGMNAAKSSGRPLVLHVHATEFDRTGGNVDQRIAEIEYSGLSKADRVIAVSDYTRHVIHDKYCVGLDRISVVHNGVDAVEFSPSDIRRVFPHDKIVLYVGRLTFQKGVEYFLKSAKMVLQENPNTVFIVAGTGDMERHLIMQAAYLGIGNRVIFTGFTQGKRLRDLYQMSDVFVMPSVSEPYGIVALEAVVSGIPTIISKQSGVSETLNQVYKVDFWDTNLIAKNIVNILKFPELAKEKAVSAQWEAQKLTWEKAARETLSVYQSIL
jgi:glycosyltransferase involved in cell wall biosynthesis